MRLSPREWIVTACITMLLLLCAPFVWQRIEPFEAGPDYRIAYRLGNDYAMYDRSCRQLCAGQTTVVLGDSVVWGHYVSKGQTLPHYLNQVLPGHQFVNLGVDGIHPAAMEGLVRYYGRAIAGKKVVLHCNLLWISSPRHDLTASEEFAFNHPALVPQFWPPIPCYAEPATRKLATVVARALPFDGWAKHLQIAYFKNMDVPTWTFEHPYANPLAAVTLKLPAAGEPPSPPPVAKSWTDQKISPFDPPWVELDRSFQWRCFRATLDLLATRGNRVFVLVGPLNEHMLTGESSKTYGERKRQVAAWLASRNIPHGIAPVLPSELYADASHPLADGYAQLAKGLERDSAFRKFLRE
jgi:hypothetical protein